MGDSLEQLKYALVQGLVQKLKRAIQGRLPEIGIRD
jgi:hypothetical protein